MSIEVCRMDLDTNLAKRRVVTDVLDGRCSSLINTLVRNDEIQNVPSDDDKLVLDYAYAFDKTYQDIQTEREKPKLALLLRVYELVGLAWSLSDLIRGPPSTGKEEAFWEEAISRLDRVIIATGGLQNLSLVNETIVRIQDVHLPLDTPGSSTAHGPELPSLVEYRPPLATQPIRQIALPSLAVFRRESTTPFIVKGHAMDWPAVTNNSWASVEYLKRVGGRGRVVPVEVGSDYTRNDWSQQFIGWEEFLKRLYTPPNDREPPLYLAQHSLMNQFPALRADVDVPPYVYSALPAPEDYPTYVPPGNDEELVINAWLGPKGTVSPAHKDPYFNCYVQVVGRKTVWLAPSATSPSMYTHAASDAMSNTSRVDVFERSESSISSFPRFRSDVLPFAQYAILEPGDLLFFPPGWWHAMRSEDVSFSVSFWF
ncbi:hypothetical protein FRB99_004846 [Tulasnella sp. 403]|nr:hypothetical protein FRB99_004846 [Tulasnella sp. 403]